MSVPGDQCRTEKKRTHDWIARAGIYAVDAGVGVHVPRRCGRGRSPADCHPRGDDRTSHRPPPRPVATALAGHAASAERRPGHPTGSGERALPLRRHRAARRPRHARADRRERDPARHQAVLRTRLGARHPLAGAADPVHHRQHHRRHPRHRAQPGRGQRRQRNRVVGPGGTGRSRERRREARPAGRAGGHLRQGACPRGHAEGPPPTPSPGPCTTSRSCTRSPARRRPTAWPTAPPPSSPRAAWKMRAGISPRP